MSDALRMGGRVGSIARNCASSFCGITNRKLSFMISLEQLSDEEWLVTVAAASTTQHRVRVEAADIRRLGQAKFSARELLDASFRFLLEREANTAILDSFDLTLISRYFPEYEAELPTYLGQRPFPQ